MAHFWPTFWTYFRWSLAFVYKPPFLYATLLFVGSLAASAVFQRPFATERWRRSYWVVVVQFFFFVATLAIGAAGPVNHLQPANRWGRWAVDAVSWISLCLGSYWVWKMKGSRWFATSVTLLQLWILFAASFVAGMALTGDWL